MIKSKSVFEFRGRHDVLDEHGQVIGTLEKDFGKSLLRSHWHRSPAVLGGLERTIAPRRPTTQASRDPSEHVRNGLTERRRSRTDRAWGYHTAQVLKTRWATGPMPLRQGA